jgi:hypothetical protein
MSHHVVASIDCDKSGFPCGDHENVKLGEGVTDTRARLKAKGWAVNVTVSLGGRKVKHDYCPLHKGSL